MAGLMIGFLKSTFASNSQETLGHLRKQLGQKGEADARWKRAKWTQVGEKKGRHSSFKGVW